MRERLRAADQYENPVSVTDLVPNPIYKRRQRIGQQAEAQQPPSRVLPPHRADETDVRQVYPLRLDNRLR